MVILIGRIIKLFKKSPNKNPPAKPSPNFQKSQPPNTRNSQTSKLTPSSTKQTVQQFSNQLPKDPNELVKQGWKDVTHPEKAKLGQRELKHPTKDIKIEFHRGEAGKAGWKGQDHYHIHNPHRTGKMDHYLDAQGNPVAKNAKASHLSPSHSPTPSTRFQNLQDLKSNTIPSHPSSNTIPTSSPSSNPPPSSPNR